MIPIGIIDANDQLIEAELDDQTYYLGLSWNQEGGLWTLSVRDLNQEILISGIAVVPQSPLLRRVRRPTLPPGDLAVTAPAGAILDRQSFMDGRAALWYFSAEDLRP
jgi:hypothetical protein